MKTLKDLPDYIIELGSDKYKRTFKEQMEQLDSLKSVLINELRDVAREWIKHMDSIDNKDLLFQAKKMWIRHFFNLEDE